MNKYRYECYKYWCYNYKYWCKNENKIKIYWTFCIKYLSSDLLNAALISFASNISGIRGTFRAKTWTQPFTLSSSQTTTTKHSTLFQSIHPRTNIATARKCTEKERSFNFGGSSRRYSGSPLIHVGPTHAHRKDLSPRRKRSNDLTLTSHHPVISQRDTKTDIVASTLAHHSLWKEIPPYGNPHGTHTHTQKRCIFVGWEMCKIVV